MTAMQNGTSSSTEPYSINSFKPLLSKLLRNPPEFTPQDLRLALLHLASGQISHAQTGSFLAALRLAKVVDTDREMVSAVVDVLTELSGSVKVGGEGQVCDWTMTGNSALSVSILSTG